MSYLGKSSFAKLRTCHAGMQIVIADVAETYNITVLEGARGKEKQNLYFANGTSKVQYPNGPHNTTPSNAVDIAPWLPWRKGKEIPWPDPKGDPKQYIKDLNYWYYMAGQVIRCANEKGIQIKWGGDWNRDHNLENQNFFDLPHFQLVGV